MTDSKHKPSVVCPVRELVELTVPQYLLRGHKDPWGEDGVDRTKSIITNGDESLFRAKLESGDCDPKEGSERSREAVSMRTRRKLE